MLSIPQNVEQQGLVDKVTEVNNGLKEKSSDAEPNPKTKGTFLDAFTASISVILLTELGDKTFFIAAIMAMRHPRLIVFGGAIAALALMTVLSCVFGMAANFIPKVPVLAAYLLFESILMAFLSFDRFTRIIYQLLYF